MRVTVIGAGHVGLVTAACLAHVGHDVVVDDDDVSKLDLIREGGNRVGQVIAGRILGVTARMDTSQLPGEEIVVVGTRLPEKRLDAPVTIEIVTEKDLKTAAGASYMSALSRVKGIDFSDAGIGDQRISARGFGLCRLMPMRCFPH